MENQQTSAIVGPFPEASATEGVRTSRWVRVLSPTTDDKIDAWINNELTGDKLADTEKFPFWTAEQGPLSQGITQAQRDSLTQHLYDKYAEWVNPRTGMPWTLDARNARIQEILDAQSGNNVPDQSRGRHALLAHDYREHIRYVASQWHTKFQVNRTWALATAIYSSSQYTPMNAIARGEYRGNKDYAGGSGDDLWLIAKAGAGIRKLAFADQSWIDALPPVPDPALTDDDNKKVRESMGERRVLRRDMEFPDKMIGELFLKPEWNLQPSRPPANRDFMVPSEQPGTVAATLASFKELGFFSTTTIQEGVAPFNENSNVVVYVELYDNNRPFPAVSIKSLSCYPQESEVLWAPGIKFLVTKIRDKRRTELAGPNAGWRQGSRQWSKDEKLEVYLRPMTALDQLRYVNQDDMLNWLKQNMTGSKIVDTDKFPKWIEDGKLQETMNQAEVQALEEHLHHKYDHWTLAGVSEDERIQRVGGKIRQLLECSRQQRDKTVGEDYIHHIKQVASAAQMTFGLSLQYTLAIAIYSSSEYSKMNMIGQGLPGSARKRAENLHVWLNAKTSYGIAATGGTQKWVSTGAKPDLVQQTRDAGDKAVLQALIEELKRGNHLPADFTPHLRRDEYDYPDNLIDDPYNLHTVDDGTPRQKGLLAGYALACQSNDATHRGYFFQPDFLLSTTMKLEGVEPFNTGNLAWIIDVSEASDEAAMNIAQLSAYPSEAEILWRYKQRFRIVYLEDRRETALYAEGEKKSWRDWKGRRKVSASHKVWVFLKAMPFTILLPAPPNQTQPTGAA